MHKKIYVLAVSLSIIVALASVEVLSAADTMTNADSQLSQDLWMNQAGQYDYPIDVLDEEWKAFTSVEEMRSVTQIPETILASISTEELIQLILKYPLLCDIHAFDTLEDGYEHLKGQFNGIQELLVRQDAFEELVAAYDAYPISEERILDYNMILSENEEDAVEQLNAMLEDDYYRELILEDAKVLETIDVLEMLLKDVSENSGSTAYMELFAESYADKVIEKTASDYYEDVSPVGLINILEMDNSELLNVFRTESVSTADQTTATIYIYTPSGKSVEAKYYVNLNYDYNSVSNWESLVETYNATWISIASTTFNCHSYAWLHSLYPDRYQHIWLNSASQFIADSAYTILTRNTAKSGTIVYYSRNAHSAVATGARDVNKYGEMELYVISKWGEGPMVKHLEKCCPYAVNSSTISYYHLEED